MGSEVGLEVAALRVHLPAVGMSTVVEPAIPRGLGICVGGGGRRLAHVLRVGRVLALLLRLLQLQIPARFGHHLGENSHLPVEHIQLKERIMTGTYLRGRKRRVKRTWLRIFSGSTRPLASGIAAKQEAVCKAIDQRKKE